MGRSSLPSTTVLRTIRTHFGLTLAMLASYLRVSVGLVGHLEAGRRSLSTAVLLRLAPLAAQLPAETASTAEAAAAPAPPPLAPPAAGPLAARLDRCQHEATQLRRELKTLLQTCTHAERWQQALPTLLTAAPDERATRWLLRRQEQAAADLDADTAARYHLLRLRAEALETEAAGLAELLEKAN